MVDFANKKQHYLNEIQKIAKESFNEEQKKLACDILNTATESNIDSIYTFITQRVKTGFVFDAAPEVAHNCISLCERDDKMSFGSPMGVHHKLIIGENYDALKNLVATYTRNGRGLIDVIYIDPPYNTEQTREDGNDYKTNVDSKKFIYRDKFSRTGWLNMMNERLKLAKKLLSDTGVIFISIDDSEQAYLKVLCDEIFGENNFAGTLIIQTATDNNKSQITTEHEYMLCYAKQLSCLSKWSLEDEIAKEMLSDEYKKLKNIYNDDIQKIQIELRRFIKEHRELDAVKHYDNVDKKGVFHDGDIANTKPGGYKYEVIHPITGKPCKIPPKGYRFSKETMEKMIKADDILFGDDEKTLIKPKNRLENRLDVLRSIIYEDGRIGTKVLDNIIGKGKFPHPKSKELLKRILSFSSNKDSIILDFFAGSGTTGQAVMELNAKDGGNRQCILITNNEHNIATEVAYERLYRIINGKGTKEETFEWTYTKEQPYLTDNYIDVFNVKSYELKIDDYEQSQKLLDKAKSEFKKLNSDYEAREFDIYNQLASLKPYKKDEVK